MILPADINSWDDEHYFLWKERAAIMEFEGKMPRWKAEQEAAADIRKLALAERTAK